MIRGTMTGPVLAGMCAGALAASVSACAGPAPAGVTDAHRAGVSGTIPWRELTFPSAIAAAGSRIWVASNRYGGGSDINDGGQFENGVNSITEINATTGALIRSITAPRYQLTWPSAIAATPNAIWVANNGSASGGNAPNAVTEINATTSALIRVISASRYRLTYPAGITTTGNTVWVDNGGSVTEINASTGALIRVISAGRYQLTGSAADTGPAGITATGNTVWVDNNGNPNIVGATNTVTEINATTGALIRVISASRYQLTGIYGPAGITATGNTVWVAGNDGGGTNSVTEINAATGALIRVASSSTLDQSGYAVAADSLGAWLVTNEVGGKSAFPGADVTEFSAATGALVRSLSQPLLDNCNGILALAADGGFVWVTGSDSNDGAGWVAEFNAATGALIRKIVAAVPPEPG